MLFKIDKLIIYNSTRLALGGKTKITYTPESPFQLIIGTNSSGKSSLLKELSPLPANLADFNEGGYKEVFITCNHAKYHITSTKGGHKTHSFIKDGIELNPSGGVTIQRELCQSHFNITEEIHDLLTDNILFTEMPPDLKRKWITMMCPVDLAYANKIYHNIKTQLRDVAGALKHNDSRLNQAMEKLLELENSDENYDALIADLNYRIEGLYKLRAAGGETIDRNALLNEINQFPKKVANISNNLYPVPPTWLTSDKPDPETLCEELSYICARNDEEYASLLKKLSDVAHLMDTIKQSEESLVRVRKERSEILTKLSAIRALYPEPPLIMDEDFDERKGQLDNIMRTITSLNMDYDLGKLLRFSQKGLIASEVLSNAETIKNRLTGTEASLTSIREMIDHANHSDNVSCPKCEHSWNMAVGNVNELYDNEGKCLTQINQLTDWLRQNDEVIKTAAEYKSVHEKLSWLRDNCPEGNKIRFKLNIQDIVDGTLLTAIKEQLQVIDDTLLYAELTKSLETYNNALRDAEAMMESSKQVNDIDPDALQNRLHEVQENRLKQGKLRDELLSFISKKKAYKIALEAGVNAGDRIEGALMAITQAAFNSIGDYYINQYSSALGVIHNKKTVMEVTKGNVIALKADREDLKASEEALKVLLSALSPKEGIIAEQLYGAIQTIVSDMNTFIEGIWTYDLIVQPCSMENEELTYKFPLMVETPENVRSDVSKGSSSVKDIINFAFKQLAYDHFKLNGYPLFFDEFGATFDPEHVHRAMMYVQNAYAMGNHSAIFMVSHFENYYSNFSDADINILHTGNIRFEQRHNTCLEIT